MFPTLSTAADVELYFRTTANAFAPGSEFTVGVFVNARQPVNAFDVEVGYSVQSLELLSVNSADSLIGLWKDSPETLSAGIVRIRGVSLPAFRGAAGELLKLNFRVRPEARLPDGQATGTLQWSFRRADIYLSDGKGTRALSTGTPLILPIVASAPARIAATTDRTPPVFLSVRAAENPVDGSYFAVWVARDDDSGLRDAVLRTRRWFLWEPWESAVNPVRLPRSVWSFELKVSDNQGNSDYRIVYLWPVAAKKGAYILGGAAVLLVLAFVIRRRILRHRTTGN